jgi:hypothetical protein
MMNNPARFAPKGLLASKDEPVGRGGLSIVMATPLLATPPTVTTTLPVVAPAGTVATIDVSLQLPIVAAGVPLKVTVLVPCVEPKCPPVIVTEVPTAPDVGERLVMYGLRPGEVMGS